MAKSTAVTNPNLGLYFDRTPLNIPSRGLADGRNFRIHEGKLGNLNLGWVKFSDNWTLDGPVRFIDNFFPRNSDEVLLFGTDHDIYVYDPTGDTVAFLTPIYATGTASASGTAVTGAGTSWGTGTGPIRAGDRISFGSATEDDPSATWFTVDTVNSNTSITLVEDAGTVADGPYTIRLLFQSAPGDIWSFDTFVQDATSGDDLWIATNGVDDIISWNGTGLVTLNALGFKAKVLSVFANMMIYMALTQSGEWLPSSIINSDIGKPLDVVNGLSSQFRIHDGTDEIYNAIPLGENLAFYSERHIILAQFVGDPLVFLFREAISGLGAIGPLAIADFGDFHEFIGPDASYAFDGVSVREINAQVWRFLIRQVDPARRKLTYVHFDEERGDLIWSLPATTDTQAGVAGGQPEIAWPEHYLEDVPDGVDTPFSNRDFPFTATGYYAGVQGPTFDDYPATGFDEVLDAFNGGALASGFPISLAGDDTGQIYILNTSQTADGAPLPSFVKTGRMALGSGRERPILARVYPFAEQFDNTLLVSILMSDHAAKDASSAGDYSFDTTLNTAGLGEHFVSVFRRGRFMEWVFSTTGTPWTIWGWDFDTRYANNANMR